MQEGKVVTGRLLVACRNAPVVLDATKEPTGLVLVRIQVGVEFTLDPPVLFWRDDRSGLKRFDVCNEIITVKAFIADDRLRLAAYNQRLCLAGCLPVGPVSK